MPVEGWPYGGTPGKEVCGGNKRAMLDEEIGIIGGDKKRIITWQAMEMESQKFEHSAVWYHDYIARGAKDSEVAKQARWKDPAKPFPCSGTNCLRWREVTARTHNEMREDRAPRYQVDETVYFNDPGSQLPILHWFVQDGNRVGQQPWPMKRWNNFYAGRDFNLDSLQQIGLLPDLIQDMRNMGVQWEQVGPLFRGAQDFIDMWRRSVIIGISHP